MKFKLIFLILISLIILTGCTEEKSDYEIFTELYNEAVSNFENRESAIFEENSFYNYELLEQTIETSIDFSYEEILEPYYMKSTFRQDISTVGLTTMDILVLQDSDTYQIYSKINGNIMNESLTEDEFKEEVVNDELNITLNHIPDSIEKIKEETITSSNEKIITYETTFKLSDLETEDQILFDELIELYIGENQDTSILLDIEVTKTIVLNATTKQLVVISYDTNEVITQVFNQFIEENTLDWEICDTEGSYSFKFISLNNVIKDDDFISDMTEK